MDHMERDMLDHLASAQKVLVGIGGEWKKGKRPDIYRAYDILGRLYQGYLGAGGDPG